MSDRRNLTIGEIKELSPELKTCYLIKAWNASAVINSKEQWVDTYWVYHNDDSLNGSDPMEFEKIAREYLMSEYERVYTLLILFGLIS